MKKQIKNILVASMSMIGAVIGAGFASGREISTFFLGSEKNLFLPIIAFFLMLSIYLFISIKMGAKGAESVSRLIQDIEIPFVSVILESILMISFLITIASMSAGIAQLVPHNKKIGEIIISAIAIIVSVGIFTRGIHFVEIISSILVPIILIYILYLSLKPIEDDNALTIIEIAENPMISISKGLLYGSMNGMECISLALQLGSKHKGHNFRKFTSLFTSIGLSILVVVFGLAILRKGASHAVMPILVLSSRGIVEVLTRIIIFFAIITSLVVASFCLDKEAEKFIENKTKRRAIIASLAFIISRLGFSKIVEVLYPIMGVLALLLLGFTSYNTLFKKRNGIIYQSSKKHKNDCTCKYQI